MVNSPVLCKLNSTRYGGFDQPQLRHMMAERALHDTEWYMAAISDPKAHLPLYHSFLSRSRVREAVNIMTSQKRAELEGRAVAFLTAAQAAHVKWNGTTWTRPRHLLGLLCQEERRVPFARALLRWMAPISRLPESPEPSEAIDRLALARLREHISDGSMRTEIDLWKLDAPEVVQELRLLATAPQGDTEKSPALSSAQTPHLYKIFIPMLFVGFAHNLYVESAVSKLANLEKIHPGTDSQLLNQLFLYTARQEAARAARLQPSLRSDCGGGLREKAKANSSKPLSGSAAVNKNQQLMLCSQTETASKGYSTTQLLKRGEESIHQIIADQRGQHKLAEAGCHQRKVSSMHATCTRGPKGGKRRAAWTAEACTAVVPECLPANSKAPKRRSSLMKQKAVRKAGIAKLRTRRKEAAAAEGTRRARKRPIQRTGAGEMRVACRQLKEQQQQEAAAASKRQKVADSRERPAVRAAATKATAAMGEGEPGSDVDSDLESESEHEESEDEESESEGEESAGEEEWEGEESEGEDGGAPPSAAPPSEPEPPPTPYRPRPHHHPLTLTLTLTLAL